MTSEINFHENADFIFVERDFFYAQKITEENSMRK